MKVVNNRYIIKEELEPIGGILLRYKVEDIYNDYEKLEMMFFEKALISDDVYQFLRKYFFTIKGVTDDFFYETKSFSAVSNIDGIKKDSTHLIFTYEYSDEEIPLIDWLKGGDADRVIFAFYSILKALNSINLKGIIFPYFYIHNLFVVKDKGKDRLIHKNAFLVEISNFLKNVEGYDSLNSYFNFDGLKSHIDLEKLSAFFLSILEVRKEIRFDNIQDRLNTLIQKVDFSSSDKDRDKKLIVLSFLESLYKGEYPNGLSEFYFIFRDFAQAFSLDGQIEKEFTIISNPTLIGRDMEFNAVIHDILDKNTKTDGIFIFGEEGVGKTRFLEELSHALSMEGIILINSFNQNRDGDTLWNDLIKSYANITEEIIYNERRKDNLSKLNVLKLMFKKFNDIAEEGSRHKLGYRVAKTMSELLKDKKMYFIIDNFEYTSANILDLILYMLDDPILQKQIVAVIALDTAALVEGSDVSKFINAINNLGSIKNMSFNNLSLKDTSSLIKSKLAYILEIPELKEYIYLETKGNPLKIIEKVEDLIQKNILKLDTHTGHWNFDLDSIEVNNGIETDKLKGINEEELDLLKFLSMSKSSMNTKDIAKILGKRNETVLEIAEKLKVRGILVLYYDGISANVSFYSNTLKEEIYDSVPTDERYSKHNKILENLDVNKEENLIEMMHQLFSLGRIDEARSEAIRLADHKSKTNIEIALKIYGEALLFTKLEDYDDRINISFKISDLYLTYGEKKQATDALAARLNDFNSTTNTQIIEKYIYRYARVSFAQADKRTILSLYRKLKSIPKRQRTDLYDAIEMKLRGDIYAIRERSDKAVKIYEDLIAKYEKKEGFDYILSDAYRFAANLQAETINVNKMLNYQRLAAEASVRIGDMRTKYVALNNIAFTLMHKTLDYNRVIGLLHNIISMTRDNSIIDLEINSYLSLVDVYDRMGEYLKALDYLEIAQRRSEITGLNDKLEQIKKYTLREHLAMGNFTAFIECYEKNKEIIDSNEVARAEIYDLIGEYYFRLGDISLSIKYQKLVLNDKLAAQRHRSGDELKKDIKERKLRIAICNMLLLGQYNVRVVKKYIDFINEASFTFANHQIYLRLQRLLYAINLRFGKAALKSAMAYMSKLDRMSITKISKMYFYYFHSVITEDESFSLELLSIAEDLAKEYPYDELSVGILLDTGNFLLNYDCEDTVLVNMMKALSNLIDILEKVPSKYLYSFYNINNFKYLFEYFEHYIYNSDEDFIVGKEPHPPRVIRKNLDNIIYEIDNSERKPVDIVVKELLGIRGMSQEVSDVVKNFTADRMENIHLLLEFFAIKTLADHVLVLRNSDKGEFAVHTSYNKQKMEIDIQDVQKYLSKSDIVVMDKSDFVEEIRGVERLISFPIRLKGARRGTRDAGILLFLTGMAVSKFDELVNNYQYLDIMLLLNLLEGNELKMTTPIDKLTGALTRKRLDDELIEISKYIELGHTSTVAIFDLDRFKRVNDEFGHQAGDLVLKNTVAVALNVFPKGFKVGRYGGEEFVVIMPDIDENKASDYAETFRNAVKTESYEAYGNLKITVSVGLITGRAFEKIDDKTLIEKADRALYRAKESGRDMILFYKQEFEERSAVQTKTQGVLTGNDIRDERLLMTIAELLLYKRIVGDTEDIFAEILNRATELLEANEAGIVLGDFKLSVVKGKGVSKETSEIKEIKERLDRKDGVIFEDFYDTSKRDPITKMPIWNSVLGVNIKNYGKKRGILYFKVARNDKLFEYKDLNIAHITSNIINLYLSPEEK